MLLRYFHEASLDEFPGLRDIADLVLGAGGNEPDLPLEVLRAVEHGLHHILEGAALLVHTLICLRGLDIHFPGELTIDVGEHGIEQVLDLTEREITSLFDESQILEPEGAVLGIVLEALLTELKGLIYSAFSLLILRSFQIDGAIRGAVP